MITTRGTSTQLTDRESRLTEPKGKLDAGHREIAGSIDAGWERVMRPSTGLQAVRASWQPAGRTRIRRAPAFRSAKCPATRRRRRC
jgi:hypothetical protein